jgi:hypothetical protein
MVLALVARGLVAERAGPVVGQLEIVKQVERSAALPEQQETVSRPAWVPRLV